MADINTYLDAEGAGKNFRAGKVSSSFSDMIKLSIEEDIK
jgi:hypothetical protein